jgi:hypothetical protein
MQQKHILRSYSNEIAEVILHACSGSMRSNMPQGSC